MMEFTYDGMVRWGFGFYNPNHAAALFAALLPFLWGAWEKFPRPACRIPVTVATLLAFAALALTFSRTGAAVAVLELALYFGCRKTASGEWKRGALLLGLLFLAFLAAGALARFTLDRAVTNRLAIWYAGAALFTANPLGVGHGNSGVIATAFLLPPRIVCRTLVNSHLTLLAEYGVIAGFLWFGALFYALLNGSRHPAARTALIGLAVSAFSCSVFDWGILFDFHGAGGLPRLNQCLSWGVLMLYLGLIVFLSLGRFRPKRAGIAAGAAAAAMLLSPAVLLLAPADAPQVVAGEFLRLPGPADSLALYDGTFSLRECADLLPDGGVLPIRSAELRADVPFPDSSEVILFGECAHFAPRYPGAAVTLVAPPPHFSLPENTRRLLLKRYAENDRLELQAAARGIPCDFLP